MLVFQVSLVLTLLGNLILTSSQSIGSTNTSSVFKEVIPRLATSSYVPSFLQRNQDQKDQKDPKALQVNSKEVITAISAISYAWSSYSIGLIRLFSKCAISTTVFGPFRISLCALRMGSMMFSTTYTAVITYQQMQVLHRGLSQSQLLEVTTRVLTEKFMGQGLDVTTKAKSSAKELLWKCKIKPKMPKGKLFNIAITIQHNNLQNSTIFTASIIPQNRHIRKYLSRYCENRNCKISSAIYLSPSKTYPNLDNITKFEESW